MVLWMSYTEVPIILPAECLDLNRPTKKQGNISKTGGSVCVCRCALVTLLLGISPLLHCTAQIMILWLSENDPSMKWRGYNLFLYLQNDKDCLLSLNIPC